MTTEKSLRDLPRFDFEYCMQKTNCKGAVPDSDGDYVRWSDVLKLANSNEINLGPNAELEFLDDWIRFAYEPVGQYCCGHGQGECCGNFMPAYNEPGAVLDAMVKRQQEILTKLAEASP